MKNKASVYVLEGNKQLRCSHNKKVLPYVQWHEWAERKSKMGHKQKQCPICKLWFFKCEMNLNTQTKKQ